MLSDDDLKKYIQKMLAVVSEGKKAQRDGAHYIWGGQLHNGSAPMAPDKQGGEQDTYMRCAYMPQQGGGVAYCAGRNQSPAVLQKPKWDGRDRNAPGGQFRWPRYFVDTSTDGSPKVPSAQVWGEDCTGKLHFDCAGFVRYCFRQVLGNGRIPDGMRYASDLVWSVEKSTQPIAMIPIWPADLLYDDGYTHVGIATGHWLLTGLGVTNPSKALHCYSATVGVVATPIDSFVRWKYVYRWPKWD